MISMDRQMAINTILALSEIMQNLKEEYKITKKDLMNLKKKLEVE